MKLWTPTSGPGWLSQAIDAGKADGTFQRETDNRKKRTTQSSKSPFSAEAVVKGGMNSAALRRLHRAVNSL